VGEEESLGALGKSGPQIHIFGHKTREECTWFYASYRASFELSLGEWLGTHVSVSQQARVPGLSKALLWCNEAGSPEPNVYLERVVGFDDVKEQNRHMQEKTSNIKRSIGELHKLGMSQMDLHDIIYPKE